MPRYRFNCQEMGWFHSSVRQCDADSRRSGDAAAKPGSGDPDRVGREETCGTIRSIRRLTPCGRETAGRLSRSRHASHIQAASSFVAALSECRQP